ncbi:hypothetical protein HII31_11639 [Pseudocercospora fuligena]|uniref:Uncharacterized protein n=1 Tax=Pseudocercospora fuligena TaxID=685502 RepID=A0A8H6VD96_9PEZI|nr:hypothetical protein HII31_11639 [Pseudocercospora fuligena]
MARDADWYTSGTVPETPPSSTRATLSQESSRTSSAPGHAQNSQTSPPPPEPRKPKFRMTPHNRQETTNKVIQYAGKAAEEHLRTSFRDAPKLNPYLREIAKLESYPQRNGYDWDAAKREAKARGWRTGDEGVSSTPWMRRGSLRRSYDWLGRMSGGRTEDDSQAVKSSGELVAEQENVQRAPMPNGKLRRIERSKPVQAPSLPQDDTYTMDLTGDSD